MSVLNNSLILLLHIAFVAGITLGALRLGKEALVAWLCLLACTMNLFVLKQIDLFTLQITSCDALAVGYLLGLNLIQEFFGKTLARKTMWIALFLSLSFVILSQIHLFYQPNSHDVTHFFYAQLLQPMPRLFIASFASFLIVQWCDIRFFSYLTTKTKGRYLTLRVTSSLLISHLLDTLLFSFLGLYGSVAHIGHVIVVAFLIKCALIFLSTPFIYLSKKLAHHEASLSV